MMGRCRHVLGHDPEHAGADGLCLSLGFGLAILSRGVRSTSDRLERLPGLRARMQGGEIAMLNAPQFVAVDVSKAILDMAAFEGAWRTPNSLPGIAVLRKRLARYERPWVVCEATGRYARLLARHRLRRRLALPGGVADPHRAPAGNQADRKQCGRSRGSRSACRPGFRRLSGVCRRSPRAALKPG